MLASPCSRLSQRLRRFLLAAAPALVLTLCGCKQEVAKEAPPPRPVRTVVVQKGGLGQSIVLTGQIQAEKEVALAFRIGGRIIERLTDTGDRVEPDQVVARLDPQNELNSLRSTQAALAAARARLEQDSNHFDRQETLLKQGWTTRASFDQAQQALRTARATVDDAKAQVEIAEDRVSYTQLKAGVSGTITRRAAESGEVVQAGQMVFTVARETGWDAVFDVPAQVLRTAPGDADVIIALTDDPSVTAKGRVRQVDPQADPVTRTFKVRVAVSDPPPSMRLGATVSGTMEVDHGHGISLPASALTATEKNPAVWVVDPKSMTVALKPVDVLRFDPGTVVLSGGLDGGEIVVTAGVQVLHPGQKVRPLGVKS
ncbi:efflux RND transporter periplasmic adaptor subunit [Bradyrhizobium sp. 41S5]|uniref:efflux RND transporter periplasmic adaptor subunit n=1 Tax=Bradyrhizobium sp. 41S5 TaxID=1404443 RepID=UPI00156B0730|nr:efflux RND transporter periplasmic adaptor subunit [Bradyrhizobium sp. 41S5]UFX48275.1 efflux RND transporter periplasmic adaptor subunit [Bradyrhizobium sp. 41S5]